MHLRCYQKSHPAYDRYGGRGIKVCPEWYRNFAAFRAWALANGYADNLSIDRIDNNKGYEPSNCRWATKKQQARNRQDSIYVTAFGERKLLLDWFDDARCLVAPNVVRKRLYAGHEPEWAMTATEHELRSAASIERENRLRAARTMGA